MHLLCHHHRKLNIYLLVTPLHLCKSPLYSVNKSEMGLRDSVLAIPSTRTVTFQYFFFFGGGVQFSQVLPFLAHVS